MGFEQLIHVSQKVLHRRDEAAVGGASRQLERLDQLRIDGLCGMGDDVGHHVSGRKIVERSRRVAVHRRHDKWCSHLRLCGPDIDRLVSRARWALGEPRRWLGAFGILDHVPKLVDVLLRVVPFLLPDLQQLPQFALMLRTARKRRRQRQELVHLRLEHGRDGRAPREIIRVALGVMI